MSKYLSIETNGDFVRILFLGDVFGKVARQKVVQELPKIRQNLDLDFVVVNGENATQGKGITTAHAEELFRAGIDCMTLGDHALDQRDIHNHFQHQDKLLRPLNLGYGLPGKGYGVYTTSNGKKVLVMVALGQVFMKRPHDNPIRFVNEVLERYPMGAGKAVDSIVLDFHCEATSEKMIAGRLWDGKVSLVVGTHTHIPTSDARIQPKGTGYITDAGMCGDYDSIIGMDPAVPTDRFAKGHAQGRMIPAKNEATLCGVFVKTDDQTGLVVEIKQFIQGGILQKC